MTGDVALVLAAASAALAGWLSGPPGPGRPGRTMAMAARWARTRASRLGLLARRRPVPVAELVSGLAAELAAGQPLAVALEEAASGLDPDPCPRARQAALVGGEVGQALLEDARAPGGGGLVALAAGWDVAQRSGAGLATALDRLGEGLRAAEQARAQLSGEVAAVRASARLLAALPAFGLLIGQVIGADPLAWLAGHWAGRIALVGGLVLQAVGLMWLNRVVAAARRAL